jgi:signal transduction histidine kinase/ABC-type amino acid transport substrate-binding protein/ActR/RegA family two-component response regulator
LRVRGLLTLGEDGRFDGFARRLIQLAAEGRGLTVDFLAVGSADGLEELLRGEIDVACPLTISHDRLEKATFASPILIMNGAVVTRAGEAPPAGLDELRQERVKVARYGIGHQFCLEKGIPYEDVLSLREALESVLAGTSDCVVTSQLAARVEFERLGLAGLADHPLDEERLRQAYACAVRVEDKDLLAALNYGLAVARDSGAWDELYDRWVAAYQPRPHPPALVPFVIGGLLLVVLVGSVSVFVLRSRLSSSTRALDESEERYRLVAENLPALVYSYLVHGDGRRERRFVTANLSEWTRRFPALDPVAVDCGISALIHPEDRPRFIQAIERARSARSLFDLEYRLQAVDGGYRWLHSIASPLPRRGGVLWQCLLLDVTPLHEARDEQHRLELQLVQAQKLEGLGLLAGGIAHDFNNLLMGIQGNVELARQEDGPARVRHRLDEALHATRRAADLTQQLLAYAGEARLVESVVDLGEIVLEMVELLGTALSSRARVEFEFADSRPLVRADATLVRQVVMNLLTNAADAVSAGRQGRIVVRVRRASLGRDGLRGFSQELEPGDYALLEVEDDGVGMDEATLQRIFDPFFTTKFAGRGLGLSIVQRTVERHGGALRVRSAPDRGACFQVLLPLPAAAGPELHDPEIAPFRRAAGRILVVDDDARVLEVACAILESRGWSVARATGASSALVAARASEPDVVLLDLTMPEVSGVDTLRLLRAEFPALPVVLMSGFSEQEVSDAEVAVDGFVQKPFSGDELVSVLVHVLARRSVTQSPSGARTE